MYYLYKISLVGSPKYYIGVTCDMVNRRFQHELKILDAIELLMRKKTKKFISNSVHYVVAAFIYPLVRRFANPEKHIRKHYSITVLRRAKHYEEIKAMETRYISKDDPNSLNIHKQSHYGKKVMKEKPYVIRGNNKNQESCVCKIVYGNRYVIAKFKTQSAGLKRIEDSVNSFMRGGKNNPDGLYYHLLNYIKRQPQHTFKVKTLLFSDNPYLLLKKEQEELDAGRGNPNFLNNQATAYIPAYNEEKQMYGGWIRPIDVLNFNNWLKARKVASRKKPLSNINSRNLL